MAVLERLFIHTSVSGTDATDDKYIFNPYNFKIKIEEVLVAPQTSVATHASNYITATLSNGGTTLATYTSNSSGGTALTAGTSATMAMATTGVGTALEIAARGAARVQVTKAGTGPAYNQAVILVCSKVRES